MSVLYGDFETCSALDLKKYGTWRYSHDRTTQVLCFAYAFDDGPVEIIYDISKVPEEIINHIVSGKEFAAHNAQFELAIWNYLLVRRYGYLEIRPEQTICTMAECYAMSLPGTLENAAAALGLRVTKDTDGRALMLRMCKPINAKQLKEGTEAEPRFYHDTKEFTFMGHKISGEVALKRLGQYCCQDVEVERAIHKRVVRLSSYEKKVWVMDYNINKRGVLFDPQAVKAALEIRDKVTADLDKQMAKVTDGHVTACTALPALKDWAADYGVMPESLAKEELNYLLGENFDGQFRHNIPECVRRAFQLRQEAGRATSVSKLQRISDQADTGGRLHYLFQYHGAGTGRFAGRAVQPHNFTRDLPPPCVVEEIMELVKKREISWMEILYGPPLTVVSKLLRGFIIAGDNRSLIGGDYSNVEGRGLAWLAGEEWKLKAFKQYDEGTGPDIYKLAYGTTFDTPIDRVTKEQRQIGKVQELALGYQGGVGAFQQMAGSFDVTISDDEADDAKLRWRKSHPKIKQYWYDLQNAALTAVKNPGKIYKAGAPGRHVKFRVAGSFLWCLLPSSRTLCYPYPQIRMGDYGEFLTYKSVPSADDFKRGRIIDDPKNSRQWARVGTYGGKLAENITQAICRDLLVDAMLRLEDAGYKIVLHVHDEAIEEGDFTETDRVRVEEIMNQVPDWAKDFPLVAKCWLNKRYMKDD